MCRAPRAAVGVDDEERRDLAAPACLEGRRGEVVGGDRRGFGRQHSPAVRRSSSGSFSSRRRRSPSEITPSRRPSPSTTAVMPIILRDISWMRLGHRSAGRDARQAVARAHEVADLQEPPAEAAGRVQRGEVLLLEAAPLRDRHRERVAHGEHRRRRGRRGEVQRAGLPRDRDGDRGSRPPGRPRTPERRSSRSCGSSAGGRTRAGARPRASRRVGEGQDDVARA